MYIIAGLGNPGKEYEETRHNAGFKVIDRLSDKYNIDVTEGKFKGLIGKGVIDGNKVILVKPLTYMNDSGLAVRYFSDYFNIDINDILIIYDDMDFDVGKYKIKSSGSSAGHNGIKSIIKHLGTENFKRIRIGISKNNVNTIDYVLGRFSKDDLFTLNNVFNIVDNIIEDFNIYDFDKLMNKYN